MSVNVQNEVFNGYLTACFKQFVAEEALKLPSDEEISKMYPKAKKVPRKYIRRAKAKKYNKPLYLVYLRRAATVCLVLLSLAFGVIITAEGVREEIADTVMTWFEKHANFDYSKSNESAETDKNSNETDKNDVVSDMQNLKIGYIPQGFELSSSTEENILREYLYFAENGDYLLIGIYDSESSETGLDNENTEYEAVTIDGREIHVFYDEVERIGNVITGNSSYYIAITGICEKEELIKIIENIK